MEYPYLLVGVIALSVTVTLFVVFLVLSPAQKAWIFHLMVLPAMSIGAIASMTIEHFAYFAAFHVFQFSGMAVCLHRYFSHRCFTTSRWFHSPRITPPGWSTRCATCLERKT